MSYFLYSKTSNRLSGKLAFGAILIWLLIQVDAIFPRVQMWLFHGTVPIPGLMTRLLLIVILTMTLLVRPQVKIPSSLALGTIGFGIYLILVVFFRTSSELSLLEQIYGYYLYYFFIFLTPLLFVLRGSLSEALVIRLLIMVFVPLALFGIVQNHLGQPLLSTGSIDGKFNVIAWGYPGYVRGFSLFGSGLSFGHYLALIAPLSFSSLLKQKKMRARFLWFSLFALSLVATYTTLTRLVILWVLASLVFVLLFVLLKHNRTYLVITPLVFGILGVILAAGLPTLLSQTSTPIFSGDSLNIRLEEWRTLGALWTNKDNWMSLLFGLGLVQTNNNLFTQNIVTDNTYLAVGIHIGIFGLIIILVFLWKIWSYCLKQAILLDNPLSIGIAAFVSAWMLAGIYNIEIDSFILASALLVWTTGLPANGK